MTWRPTIRQGRDIPRHVLDAVERAVATETVIWVGPPDAGLAFCRSAWLWVIALPWFMVTLTAGISLIVPPPLRPVEIAPGTTVFGLMLIGIIVWVHAAIAGWLCLKPFGDARRASNRAHVVTATSVMTVTATPDQKVVVTRALVTMIDQIERSDLPGGFGTLTIRHRERLRSRFGLARDAETWHGVPDAGHVERLVVGLAIPPAAPVS
ncbi:MAG: hypothetical protein SH859_14630 [Hyphomicrobium aestuarii]|nr:hypothetical protein [Hyphomicrobium aestuarii]